MSSSDYEDSQPAEAYTVDAVTSKPRPSRTSHIGTRRTSALYAEGGPLDSQTTDSQWVSSLNPDPQPRDDDLLAKATVETFDNHVNRAEHSDEEDLEELREYYQEIEADNEFLRDEVARLGAAYQGVMEHLDAIRALVALGPLALDPLEQSQVALELPPVPPTPSRARLGNRWRHATARAREPSDDDVAEAASSSSASMQSTSTRVLPRLPATRTRSSEKRTSGSRREDAPDIIVVTSGEEGVPQRGERSRAAAKRRRM